MAAALTHKGVHHTWQGCPSSGGWSHAVSSDFVHWEDLGIDVKTLNETYAGMESVESPCSGFVALNDEGVPCAGFRQCASTHGITDHNPDAQDWDVPLEIRCATNADLTTWSEPKYIFDQYYYRGLPYDPARPWKDTDDKWYMAMSVDGCNSTTKAVPCAAGGQLDLWTADNFEGPWRQLDTPLFTTNKPKKGYDDANPIFYEFVTSGYFGGLAGDPDSGSTRVVTENNGGAHFWVGKQAGGPGSPFEPNWENVGATGHYDFGSLTMARTLGSDANQVATEGRKNLVGWIGGGQAASQSLGRELSLSSDYELLQQFVPELKCLRKDLGTTGLQTELTANFQLSKNENEMEQGLFGVDVACSEDGRCARIFANCTNWVGEQPTCEVGVDATQLDVQGKSISGPLTFLGETVDGKKLELNMHAIVDGEVIEVIFNNRTAMVHYAQVIDEKSVSVELFGNVGGKLESWELETI